MQPTSTHATHEERLERATLALAGLSLGDAFGQRFFVSPEIALARIGARTLPAAPWYYTDDTEMALGLHDTLRVCRGLDQDVLSRAFVLRYGREPGRGYGAGMHRLFEKLLEGGAWRTEVTRLFEKQGSLGNGGAMRVAPLAGYFADDVGALVEAARASAAVTHAHPDGQAGTIAAAVAGAWAWARKHGGALGEGTLWDAVLAHTPDSLTRAGLVKAATLPPDASLTLAANALGNGDRVTSADTVPFALWCAARCIDDFVEAQWLTVEALGDRDTTCAIVGGIVALSVGADALPAEWLARRESLGFDRALFR